MFGQHDDPVILRRSGPGDRERPGELTQVERVLDGVELEALARQRSVGQSRDKWMAQDCSVDRLGRRSELVRERCLGDREEWCAH